MVYSPTFASNLMVNVGKYNIPGAYGIYLLHRETSDPPRTLGLRISQVST